MKNNVQILCTRPLDELLIKEAENKGVDVDVSPFIETEPIESVEVQQEIEAVFNASATVVFTSMNAVEAVAENRIDEQPEWVIYCIGNKTRQFVQQYFPLSGIAGTADNAADLASLIVEESKAGEVTFFCGDQRRDELPGILRQHDIEVNEIVVYQTIPLPHKVKKDYLGILFFSPSAVDSFFIANKVNGATVLFAIGNTTASAIKKYTANKIIIADQPGKEGLFDKMMEYFT
jgi:uroporphyrinogen-III synthase